MPEPLGLETLAACVPTHECHILDMRLDGDLAGALRRLQPDVVAVTALTPEVYAAQDALLASKQFSEEIFTVVGGHHASLSADFHLPQVDAIAPGEGELVFPHLIDALASDGDLSRVGRLIWQAPDGQFVSNPPGRTDLDMDALAMPRRDLVTTYRSEYFFLFDRPDTSIATGRGCPYRCTFCSVWRFHQGRTRQMSAERVVREVAAARTDHVTFVDDNFLLNHRREDAIAELIKAEGLRKRFSMECRTDSIVRHPDLVRKWVDIGLYAVLLGLEGSDATLERVNKRNTAGVNDEAIRILHDLGVIIWGAFIVDPDWTTDDFHRLRDYVSTREITHTQFTVLTPLPGSVLYRRRYDELLTHDYRCYDCLHAVLPTRLPREQFYQEFATLYRQNDVGPYYELVRQGKLTVEHCRRGKRMLDMMSQWEGFVAGDPILGRRGLTVSASCRRGSLRGTPSRK
ncbi:MAG: B12-binding domain-containing radical SAM protein [Planctomycetota bacterium]